MKIVCSAIVEVVDHFVTKYLLVLVVEELFGSSGMSEFNTDLIFICLQKLDVDFSADRGFRLLFFDLFSFLELFFKWEHVVLRLNVEAHLVLLFINRDLLVVNILVLEKKSVDIVKDQVRSVAREEFSIFMRASIVGAQKLGRGRLFAFLL